MSKDDYGRTEVRPSMQSRFNLAALRARLARMLPRARWVDLTPDEARELDLHPMVRWQVLDFAWGSFGVVLSARPASARQEPNANE